MDSQKSYQTDSKSKSKSVAAAEGNSHPSSAETVTVFPQSTPDVSTTLRSRTSFRLDYETMVWIVFGALTILWVVDRFVWNGWPRETYQIGRGNAGSDFKDGLKPGPLSVKLYDAIARISGRYSIIALNLMFFTMMHTTMHAISESKFLSRVFDFSNMESANRRIHKYNGILLCIFTLMHVWSILLPCITDGYAAQVVLGHFEWPASERGPKGFKDVNILTKTMSLQGDDVFRIIEMTLLLGVLIPLTVKWFATRWHLAIHLHGTIAVLYFIDIVRRHTHPHSWILNTPFFVAWIVDIIVGCYWRKSTPKIHRRILSDDYMLLYWCQTAFLNTVGPKFSLRLRNSSKLERSHVFTGLENRLGLSLPFASGLNNTAKISSSSSSSTTQSTSQANDSKVSIGKDWTSCLLIRVYYNRRKMRLPKQDKVSHASAVSCDEDLDMFVWGPFNSDMSEKVTRAIVHEFTPVTLVAGGSAGGYLIDGLQQFVLHGSCGMLKLLYTTADIGVFQWIVEAIVMISSHMDKRKESLVSAAISLTNGVDGIEQEKVKSECVQRMRTLCEENNSSVDITVQNVRLNFQQCILSTGSVCFQGSAGLREAVEKGCKGKQNVNFIAGPEYDGDKGKINKNGFLERLRKKYSSICV